MKYSCRYSSMRENDKMALNRENQMRYEMPFNRL